MSKDSKKVPMPGKTSTSKSGSSLYYSHLKHKKVRSERDKFSIIFNEVDLKFMNNALLRFHPLSFYGHQGTSQVLQNRQWPEVSDFVAHFCTLCKSENTRTCENRTLNKLKFTMNMLKLHCDLEIKHTTIFVLPQSRRLCIYI